MISAIRFIDSDWDRVLGQALVADNSEFCVVSPSITRKATERLLSKRTPPLIRVITRFNLSDFYQRVSGISALRLLMEHGARIRGVWGLHAKLYLFGGSSVVVTSANLTDAALRSNHEFGLVSERDRIVARCRKYFDDLWGQTTKSLVASQIDGWEKRPNAAWARGAAPSPGDSMPDEGERVRTKGSPVVISPWADESPQAFVKFFGEDRADRDMTVYEEVTRSGCHWACTYPKGKRPRRVQDGAVMFMGRLVHDPNDILVYGRAVGIRHEPGRDDANSDDIKIRERKARWPHYVRVRHPEFVDGMLKNGVSLNDLMDDLKADSLASTQRNAKRKSGNTDPRRSLMQQSAVELTFQGYAWLNDKLEAAFESVGKLSAKELRQLDWPEQAVESKRRARK